MVETPQMKLCPVLLVRPSTRKTQILSLSCGVLVLDGEAEAFGFNGE